MRIELAKLETTDGNFAHSYTLGELVLNDERVRLAEAPNISGKIVFEGRVVKVAGKIRARAEVDCDRCLKPIDLPVDSSFELEYVTVEDYESIHAAELAPEDLSLSIFDGLAIDLDGIAREQVLLAVPFQALCQANCKGLCPICGTDRNLTDCGCETTEMDPRWAALKELVNRKS